MNWLVAQSKPAQNDEATLETLSQEIASARFITREEETEIKTTINGILQKTRSKTIRAKCHISLAEIYHKKGDVSSAIREYDTASRLIPKNAAIPLQLAIIYEELTEYDKAISYYNKTMAIVKNERKSPENEKILFEVGYGLLRIKQKLSLMRSE